MAFIREIKRKGKSYFYLVESYRDQDTGKVRQRNLKYIGTERPRGEYSGENVKYTAEDAIKRRLRKTNRKERTPEEKLGQALSKIGSGFTDIAIMRENGELTNEMLLTIPLDLYSWRDSTTALIKETENAYQSHYESHYVKRGEA